MCCVTKALQYCNFPGHAEMCRRATPGYYMDRKKVIARHCLCGRSCSTQFNTPRRPGNDIPATTLCMLNWPHHQHLPKENNPFQQQSKWNQHQWRGARESWSQYLGSQMGQEGNVTTKVSTRTSLATNAFTKLASIWRTQEREKLHHLNYLLLRFTVLTYECESWQSTHTINKKTNHFRN